MTEPIGGSIVENRKYYKRNKILNLIRTRTECSRYDIKKLTAYSMATVLSIVEELLAKGFIYEEESVDTKVGRKPNWLRINPNFGAFIGIEFNATRMHCVMLDFCENVVFDASCEINRDDRSEDVLCKLANLADQALSSRTRIHLFGIGVGVPGYYDRDTGVAYEYAFIKAWRNVEVKRFVEERFHCPCYLENNVTAMAIGYKHLVLPTGYSDDFLFVSIRSGVRLVPVINNELFLSNKGYAGQLGHTKARGSNRLCSCGKRGCLNTEVADIGLRSKLIEAVLAGGMTALFERAECDLKNIDVKLFVTMAMEGDEDCLRLLRETAVCLGESLGVMLDILAPRNLVLYGELLRAGDLFLDPLKAALSKNAIAVNVRSLTVTACAGNDRMGAYGAASMVIQRQFEFLKETV